MSQVLIRENGLNFTAQCPNCSMEYIITEETERDGKTVAIPDTSKAPATCKRCRCSMNPSKQTKFANDRAVADKMPGKVVAEVTESGLETEPEPEPEPDGDDDDDC